MHRKLPLITFLFTVCTRAIPTLPVLKTFETSAQCLNLGFDSEGRVLSLSAVNGTDITLTVFDTGSGREDTCLFKLDSMVTPDSTSMAVDKKNKCIYISAKFDEVVRVRTRMKGEKEDDTVLRRRKGVTSLVIGKFNEGEVPIMLGCIIFAIGLPLHHHRILPIKWKGIGGTVPALLILQFGGGTVKYRPCDRHISVTVLDGCNLKKVFYCATFTMFNLTAAVFLGGEGSVQCSELATLDEAHYFMIATKMKLDGITRWRVQMNWFEQTGNELEMNYMNSRFIGQFAPFPQLVANVSEVFSHS